jgi:hypothetical protein
MTQPVYEFPDDTTIGHDLDPNADGDLVVTVEVPHMQALLLAANSTSGKTWSASIRWIDNPTDDNLIEKDSKSDLSLSSTSQGNAQPARKGPYAEVTLTSEETSGTENKVNVYVDAHR